MPSAPQTPEQTQCPVCRAEISPALKFCDSCGAQISETTAQEIRNVNYLLSEIARWETDGSIRPEQANQLRADYERRREELHAQLAVNAKQSEPSTPQPEVEISALEHQTQQPSPLHANSSAEQYIPNAPTFSASTLPPPVPPQRRQRRVLLETLADPHTIRLLLYTGAAMLVVGVVIWLRDVLYLKLQEPIVQAALLVIGTLIVTVSGWLAILRTRLLLTGRALMLMGSLLVPVNFWFLVRSGLIENHGRAWIVCAFCALLYASTAALLHEKLYVYLASVASIATAWTIIYRIEREAFGLYALSLMTISLIFLHLFRLRIVDFGLRIEKPVFLNPQSAIRNPQLFRSPLVHVALFGATVSALLYMLLRLGTSPSFADGILRLRASDYDPGVAMLLFALGAYAAWFAGRYIYTDRRALLDTIAVLALCWIEFLAADGFGLSVSLKLLALAVTAFVVALSSRVMRDDVPALALYRASLIVGVLIVSVLIVSFFYVLLFIAPSYTITDSAILIFLALTCAVASAPRFSKRVAAATLAYASAVFASAAFLVALMSLNLKSETLFYTACASWPFALYLVARLTRRARREMQLSLPFMIVADVEFALLLLFVAVVAFALNQAPEERILAVENLRGATFCVLFVTAIYGALRSWLEHSFVGAMIIPVAVCLAVLIALRVDAEWFAVTSVLMLFPTFFAMSKYARAREIEWLAQPASVAAGAVIALGAGVSLAQAFAHLHVGDPLLLAPCVALGAVAFLSFAASLWARSQERVTYFRAGLCATVITFAFACLRAGYDPVGNIEIYTSPVALLLLAVAYLSVRRRWNEEERASEISLLLWFGSLLLCAPVLIHALQYRLLLSVPAAGRDLLTLCAALALIFFGVLGRLRAPSLVGAVSLALELLALALTSVDWVQIPLKVYLISVGALILLIWGLLEFRREQILLMRQRFNKRREYARERFGEWR